MSHDGSRFLRWDSPVPHWSPLPVSELLGAILRLAVQFVAFLALLLAFACQCGIAAILSISVLLAAFNHPHSAGRVWGLAIVAGLGLTTFTLIWTVRGIRSLNESMTRGPESREVVRPSAGKLDPLWDRDLDDGYWPWNRG
jgi:hypothetical protein